MGVSPSVACIVLDNSIPCYKANNICISTFCVVTQLYQIPDANVQSYDKDIHLQFASNNWQKRYEQIYSSAVRVKADKMALLFFLFFLFIYLFFSF